MNTPSVQTSHNRNFKEALIALGFLVASSVIALLGLDFFYPGENTLAWIFIGLAFFLAVMAGIYATMTFIRVLKEIRENDHAKNYAALIISGLVLAAILYEVAKRLML